jgi:hypothetical protein
MLKAIYDKPIEIDSVERLDLITDIADHFGALPSLANAVTEALPRSPWLITMIIQNCLHLLGIAEKLRNKLLFTECMIYATGPWTQPRYLELPDSEVKKACEKAYNGIQLEIEGFFQRMVDSRFEIFEHETTALYLNAQVWQWEGQDGSHEVVTDVGWPTEFRDLANEYKLKTVDKELGWI